MQKIFVSSKIIFSVAFLVLTLSALPVLSQTSTPEPVPTDSPEYLATKQAFFDELNVITISDYRVAYFIDTRETYDELVSPETIRELTGAVIIDSKEAFQEYQQSGQPPIEIALIHGSMFKKIDRAWARNAYRANTVTFVGIDMRSNHLADLVGDNCIYVRGSEIFDHFDHSYFILIYQPPVTAETSEEEKARMYHDHLDLCRNVVGAKGFGQSPILEQGDLDGLIRRVTDQARSSVRQQAVINPEATQEA